MISCEIGAMKSVRFVQENGTSPLGYDLDELCTKAACKPVSPPLGPAKPFGVDNAVGQSVGTLYKDGGNSDDIAHGRYGLVVRLEGWNGKSDDPAARVSVDNVVGVRRRS
jgi:hypothetical protein